VNLPRALGSTTGVPWRPVALLTASGVGLLLVGAAWNGSSVAGTAVTVGVPLLAAAAAYVLDEAADEAAAAAPTSLRARSMTRLVVAAMIVGLGALALGVVALHSGSGAQAGITVQLVGLALVAVAASAAARRRVAEPGDAVGSALLALVLTLALSHPLDRWVSLFPSEPDLRWGVSLALWAAAAVASVAGLWVATRDPLD
jgi:hypothetical protein